MSRGIKEKSPVRKWIEEHWEQIKDDRKAAYKRATEERIPITSSAAFDAAFYAVRASSGEGKSGGGSAKPPKAEGKRLTEARESLAEFKKGANKLVGVLRVYEETITRLESQNEELLEKLEKASQENNELRPYKRKYEAAQAALK